MSKKLIDNVRSSHTAFSQPGGQWPKLTLEETRAKHWDIQRVIDDDNMKPLWGSNNYQSP